MVDDSSNSERTNYAESVGESGIHGVPELLKPQSTTRRLFWLMVVLASIAMCIFYTTSVMLEWRSKPTSTRQDWVRLESFQLPTMALCIPGTINATAAASYGLRYCLSDIMNMVFLRFLCVLVYLCVQCFAA